jgi:hypothetical protein
MARIAARAKINFGMAAPINVAYQSSHRRNIISTSARSRLRQGLGGQGRFPGSDVLKGAPSADVRAAIEKAVALAHDVDAIAAVPGFGRPTCIHDST